MIAESTKILHRIQETRVMTQQSRPPTHGPSLIEKITAELDKRTSRYLDCLTEEPEWPGRQKLRGEIHGLAVALAILNYPHGQTKTIERASIDRVRAGEPVTA